MRARTESVSRVDPESGPKVSAKAMTKAESQAENVTSSGWREQARTPEALPVASTASATRSAVPNSSPVSALRTPTPLNGAPPTPDDPHRISPVPTSPVPAPPAPPTPPPPHVLLARDGTLLARFVLADTLRTDAPTLVEGLRRRGIETTIASGDSTAAVERVARDLGVAHHLAGLSPEDKLDEAARLTTSGERVLMLGDGVNDTPALAGAHVSVAMGRGAAAAAARADAVLIGDDPGRLLAALDIARRARRILKQNLAWALGYNLVALPLAAAGAVPPWAAAIGMSLSSLVVAGNALRVGRGSDTTGS